MQENKQTSLICDKCGEIKDRLIPIIEEGKDIRMLCLKCKSEGDSK